MRHITILTLAVFLLLASYAQAETVGACNLPSSATVQVRVYDITDTSEDVAWTSTGVTERANGQGKSCYYYSATLEAGHSYQVDWKDDSSPVKTASQVLSGMETSVDAAVSTRSTPAQVNAEVVDVMTVDTVAEMTAGAPPANPTLEEIFNYIYRLMRNTTKTTSSTITVYADDSVTPIFNATISDSGSVFTKGEYATP